jgi:2-oxoglutarate ferredoxin oxidoreductase subunit delta
MIEIVINPDYCKGCSICIVFCPRKVLQPSQDINARGYILPEAVDLDACTQCKLCEIVCPDLAIAVTPKRKRISNENK